MGLFVPHHPRANIVSTMICLTVVRTVSQTTHACTRIILHITTPQVPDFFLRRTRHFALKLLLWLIPPPLLVTHLGKSVAIVLIGPKDSTLHRRKWLNVASRGTDKV